MRIRRAIINTISFPLLCSKGVNSGGVGEDEDGKRNNIKTLQRARCVPETVKCSMCMNSSTSLEVGTLVQCCSCEPQGKNIRAGSGARAVQAKSVSFTTGANRISKTGSKTDQVSGMGLQDENLSSHQEFVKQISRVCNARESENLFHGQLWGAGQTPRLERSLQVTLRA